MKRRAFLYFSSVALTSCSLVPTQESSDLMARAATELMRISVNNGVTRLTQSTLGEVERAITLPEELSGLQQSLQRLGVGQYLESIEEHMHTGIEQTVKAVQPFLLSAANQISPLDAAAVISGGGDAATDYLRRTVGGDVEQRFEEELQSHLSQLGFYADYRKLKAAYSLLPMVNKPDLDIESQLVSAGVNLLFDTIGEEEIKIRKNPKKAASEVLGGVLGG